MRYFTNVHDLGDLKSALAEAFEIKKDRYKYARKDKTCLLKSRADVTTNMKPWESIRLAC